MKHIYTLFVLLGLVFPLPSLALAQENDSHASLKAIRESRPLNIDLKSRIDSARDKADERKEAFEESRQERRVEVEARKIDLRAQIQERREAAGERRVEFQREVASRSVKNVTRVISATIERLERITERLESRIKKFDERGTDISEALKYVDEAKFDLNEAKVGVSTLASIELSSEDAQDNFERVRLAAKEVKELIKNAHENLRMAVSSLSQSQSASSDEEIKENE